MRFGFIRQTVSNRFKRFVINQGLNLMKLNMNDDEVEDLYFTEDPIKRPGIYVGKHYFDVQNLNWEK